jgi:cytochrome P450
VSNESEFKDFDHRAHGHDEEAPCVWARMRQAPGLAHSEKYGGFYVVTRYDDLYEAAVKCQVFSSAQGLSFPDLDFATRMIPAEVDPPLHKEYRNLLTNFLTRERIAQLEPAVRRQAQRLMDRFAHEERIDFIAAYARALPVLVSLRLLGLPPEDADRLDHLVDLLHTQRGAAAAQDAATELTRYIERALIAHRDRAKEPGESILSSIVLGTVEGRPLTLAEQASIVRLLMFGGFDTTTIALGASVRWLAEHPQDAQRLRDEPDLMETAIEEFVRFASPATYLRRTVTEDTTLGGQPLHKGDRVLLSFAAANRDPTKFEAPDQVVIDRTPNHHLGFGAGVHRCIGFLVGKMMIRITLQEFLGRYRDFQVDPAGTIEWKVGENLGMASLPLILRPVAAGAAADARAPEPAA